MGKAIRQYVHNFGFLIFSLALCLCLVGCDEHKQVPVWEQVKLSDLGMPQQTGTENRIPISYVMYVFDMPATKIAYLHEIWPLLSKHPIDFADEDTFAANGFRVGFGQMNVWDQVASVLRENGGTTSEVNELYLYDDVENDFVVRELFRRQKIRYLSRNGRFESEEIGYGELAVRLHVKRIAGYRGVVDSNISIAFSGTKTGVLGQMDPQQMDKVFSELTFSLKMSPGDFLFLGPQKLLDPENSLGGMYFMRKGILGAEVRTYLIVCVDTND